MTRVDLARLSDVASGIPSGTSFPGSPADNDLFYRTDLDTLFFYNGTRWLTTQLHRIATSLHNIAATTQYAAPTTTMLRVLEVPVPQLSGGSDLWLEDLSVVFNIASGGSALSGSDKWVGTLFKRIADGSKTTIATVTIDSGASGVWRASVAAIDALLNNGTTHYVLGIDWTITGTPGSPIFSHIDLTYRIVAT